MEAKFQKTLEKYQHQTSQLIKNYIDKKINSLPTFGDEFLTYQHKIVKDIFDAPSKRLRSAMTIFAYLAAGGKNPKKIALPSLAFEIFHNYTLIHDDIYDEDRFRRNELAPHESFSKWFIKNKKQARYKNVLYSDKNKRFGVVSGFLVGEYLHNLSAAVILESNLKDRYKLKGLKLQQKSSLSDNAGQSLDLSLESSGDYDEDQYFITATYKTSNLFKSSVEWGAILADANVSQISALKKFMEEMGHVYQIKDDLLDLNIGGKKGRPIGSDIKKGKKTLLTIHALAHATAEERKFILKILGSGNAGGKDLRKLIKIFRLRGSVDYCYKITANKTKKAITHLEKAKPSFEAEGMDLLINLAKFMFDRKS
jgi:geranylgeranyl diphosphate synthase type I